jgi:hypothetical protein
MQGLSLHEEIPDVTAAKLSSPHVKLGQVIQFYSVAMPRRLTFRKQTWKGS